MKQTYWHGKSQYSKRLDDKLAKLLAEEEAANARPGESAAAAVCAKEEGTALPPVMIYTSLEAATAEVERVNRAKAVARAASAAKRAGEERRSAIALAKTSAWSSMKMWQTYEESRAAAQVQRDTWAARNKEYAEQQARRRSAVIPHAARIEDRSSSIVIPSVIPPRPSTVPNHSQLVGQGGAAGGTSWAALELQRTSPAFRDGDADRERDSPRGGAATAGGVDGASVSTGVSPPIIPYLRAHTPDPQRCLRSQFAGHPFAPAGREKYTKVYAHHATSPLRRHKEVEGTPPPVPQPYAWVDEWMNRDSPVTYGDPPGRYVQRGTAALAARDASEDPMGWPESAAGTGSLSPSPARGGGGAITTPVRGGGDDHGGAGGPFEAGAASRSPPPRSDGGGSAASLSMASGGVVAPMPAAGTAKHAPRYLREAAARRPTLIHQMVPLPKPSAGAGAGASTSPSGKKKHATGTSLGLDRILHKRATQVKQQQKALHKLTKAKDTGPGGASGETPPTKTVAKPSRKHQAQLGAGLLKPREVSTTAETLRREERHEEDGRTSVRFRQDASRVRVALERAKEYIEGGIGTAVAYRAEAADVQSVRVMYAGHEREARAAICQEEALARIDLVYGPALEERARNANSIELFKSVSDRSLPMSAVSTSDLMGVLKMGSGVVVTKVQSGVIPNTRGAVNDDQAEDATAAGEPGVPPKADEPAPTHTPEHRGAARPQVQVRAPADDGASQSPSHSTTTVTLEGTQ